MERAGNVEFTRRIQRGSSFRLKKQDRNVLGKSCIGKGTICGGRGGFQIRISSSSGFQKAEFSQKAEKFHPCTSVSVSQDVHLSAAATTTIYCHRCCCCRCSCYYHTNNKQQLLLLLLRLLLLILLLLPLLLE